MKAVIKSFIVLFLLMLAVSLPASQVSKSSHVSNIQVRRPTAEKISRYQTDKNFNYEEPKHIHLNIWEQISDWLAKLFVPKGSGGGYRSANLLWTLFELLIAAASITLFIYFILKSQGVSLFSKDSASNLNFTEAHEDISRMNFDELIAKAVASGQYRQAVRYLYLKSLKQLSDLELIKWKADKTNRDYTIELRSSPYAKLFSDITYLFDYAWYGNATISENTFIRIKSTFEKFNRQTSQRT